MGPAARTLRTNPCESPPGERTHWCKDVIAQEYLMDWSDAQATHAHASRLSPLLPPASSVMILFYWL